MYPEVQAKAFEELNRVIGYNRLPRLVDLDDLAYMEAIWKETLRWSPPTPFGKYPIHRLHNGILIKNIL